MNQCPPLRWRDASARPPAGDWYRSPHGATGARVATDHRPIAVYEVRHDTPIDASHGERCCIDIVDRRIVASFPTGFLRFAGALAGMNLR